MVNTGVGAIFVLMAGILAFGVAFLLGVGLLKLIRLVLWAVGNVVKLLGRGAGRILRFGRSTVVDALQGVGAVLTAAVITPLAGLNLAMGRWSAAKHYGLAIEDELLAASRSLYRVALGNPARLLGLTVLTDGLEKRIPSVIDRAPGLGRTARAGKPSFDGYKILDTLPTGGSGARLYVARPTAYKLDEFRELGLEAPGKVVIKAFDIERGSTLRQMFRESGALRVARRMGLVLDHEEGDTSFYYVMRYVPGEDLSKATAALHAASGPEGLSDTELARSMGYAADLLKRLEEFHRSGLWHKDVKPSNLIVSDDRVHIVDLGLVTPLQSTVTLTTHGTEYYRDPEMVRLALRGVRVDEVDGVKFDVYSAGAVLYSMVESSFPAQGSLSPIAKRCPEALQWIVRRAMADMNARYSSAREMLDDLEVVRAAVDPFAVRPVDLPSVGGDASGSLSASAPPEEPIHLRPPVPRTALAGERKRPLSRRRVGRRMVAAASLVGLMVIGASAIDRRFESRFGHAAPAARRTAVAHGRQEPERTQRVRESLNDRGLHRVREVWRQQVAREIDARFDDARGRRVLLLEEARSDTARAMAEATLLSLGEAGVVVLGRAGECTPDALHQESAALNAIGLGDPEDERAVEGLQAFVDRSAELDGVFWLAELSGGRIVHRFLARSGQVALPVGVGAGD